MNPAGISSLPFRSTPSLLALLIPIWQLGMLKKTKQTHQTKRCYLNPALRNTTRNHRKERLKAPPRATAADWAPASPQSLSRGQSTNLGREQQPVLGPAKGSGLVCTAAEERAAGTQSYHIHGATSSGRGNKIQTQKNHKQKPTPHSKNSCSNVLQRESAKKKAFPLTGTLKLK